MKNFEIPDRVRIVPGNGGLPKIVVTTRFSAAEIYLHGATLTHFQKTGEPPLIFTSRQSLFAADKPIRGGVPICYPWFGARAGSPAHGIARISEWELAETNSAPDGSVKINLSLPDKFLTQAGFAPAKTNFIVTVGENLTMELRVENVSAQDFIFENCLHTYFQVGDVGQISIAGLKGHDYLDKVSGFDRKTETNDEIKIASEVDRVYLNATGAAEIHDDKFRRKIVVEKSGSNATVVWNPWIEKARAMADFGDDEFKEMVCVESGNVGESKLTLAPGQISTLRVNLRSEPLK